MFKCYRQIEHSDCGLTCVRMLAKSYGLTVPLSHLKKVTDINRLGMSIRDITKCLSEIRMESAAIKIGLDIVDRMPLPAILYWQQRHFVVLYKLNSHRQKYYVADPAQGKVQFSREEFSKYWIPAGQDKGLAILSEPADNFNNQKFEKENIFKEFSIYLLNFFKGHRFNFILALFVTLIIMAGDFAVPLLLRKTIDDGIGLRNLGLISSLLLCQLAIFSGSLIASNFIEWIMSKTGLCIHVSMMNSFLERLSRFPLSFFDRKVSSDFVQKISDQSKIKDFLLSFPNGIVITLLTAIIYSVLLCHFSKIIFIVFIFLSILEICWASLFFNRRKSLNFAEFTKSSENYNHAYELTNGMADLKVNNAEGVRIEKWKETQDGINDIVLKSAKLNMILNGGQSFISRGKELLVTGIGAAMVISGDLTIGTLMTLGYITGRLSQPFTTIGSSLYSLQNAILSYQRVADVINDEFEVRGSAKFTEPTISLRNVDFKYAGSSSPLVIKNVCLDIGRGETVALVGESGCGKSTLIKLMLGFYLPLRGKIILSGVEVQDLDNSDWLHHCGVVMQETRIFTGSILENISMIEATPDIKKVEELLEVVGLRSFVESLPMKLHTRIGVSGIEMSGGQKQRLMIARALYKEPDILFLDEATSSLDANNERSIVEKINEFSHDKTIIIAAHRLSTVKNADKIVYIKNGEICEMGTHSELVEQQGDYMRLVQNQLQLSI